MSTHSEEFDYSHDKNHDHDEYYFNPWNIGAASAICAGVAAVFLLAPATAVPAVAAALGNAIINNPENTCKAYCSLAGEEGCYCGHH